jgi:hypothetical protein
MTPQEVTTTPTTPLEEGTTTSTTPEQELHLCKIVAKHTFEYY